MNTSTPTAIGSPTLSVWWYDPHVHEAWAHGELAAALADAGLSPDFYSDGAEVAAVMAAGTPAVPAVPAGVEATCHRLVMSSGDVARPMPYVFTVRVATPAPWDEPLRAWLSGEHFNHQLATTGIEWSHGYEALESPEGGARFFNIWGMTSAEPPSTEEYVQVRGTPWYAEVVPAFEASTVKRAIMERQT